MSPGRRNSILLLVALGLIGLFGGLTWMLSAPGPETGPGPAPVVSVQPGPDLSEGEHGVRGTPLGIEQPTVATEEPTTVVFPLKVELELVHGATALQAEGLPARGADATARMRGTINDSIGGPVRAQVQFLAGPNQGRILHCDAKGQFGANDLFPGRVLVDVTGPGIPGSTRELVLRKERETLLNVGYGRPANLTGEVLDADGKGIDAAQVTMDGQKTQTDGQGVFTFPQMTSGELTVYVEKPGYASVFQLLTITAASNVEKGKIKFRMEKGARLTINLPDRINAGQQATVFLLPTNLTGQRTYPWFRVNPVRLYPGGSVTLEDLPALRVTVRAYHSGAVAKPPQREVVLEAGQAVTVDLHLEPAPILIGVVKQDGKPVNDAEVSLEVPERVQATLTALGEANFLMLESEVMPDAPTAVQLARTNAAGEFQLSANEDVSRVRYLVARSADGSSQGGVILRGGEKQVDIEIKPIGAGGAEFILQTSPRFQAIPVDVTVNNTPRERVVLSKDRDLHVGGLLEGQWKVRVRWEDAKLIQDQLIELKNEVTLSVKLPEGAVIGQDDETRKRARRP